MLSTYAFNFAPARFRCTCAFCNLGSLNVDVFVDSLKGHHHCASVRSGLVENNINDDKSRHAPGERKKYHPSLSVTGLKERCRAEILRFDEVKFVGAMGRSAL